MASLTSAQWIWSPMHNDYYYVTADEQGQEVYIFSRSAGLYWGNHGANQQPPVQLETTRDAPHIKAANTKNGLDSSYQMRHGRFFAVGRVFAMLYTEAVGSSYFHQDDDTFSQVRFGELARSTIRRFIVVRVRHGFVYACAISTYFNRGALKPGCVPSEHAVIYMNGTDPESCYLPDERARGMTKEPIEVIPSEPNIDMKPMSRIRFGKLYSIEMNVKVKDIGMVARQHLTKLMNYVTEYAMWQESTNIKQPDSVVSGIEITNNTSWGASKGDESISSQLQGDLDSDYQHVMNPRGFFKKGRVFMVPWPEPGGNAVKNQTGPSALVKIRRFVVVRPRANFCLCLPIHTYQRQATTKRGVAAEDHAAVVMEGGQVELHPGEKQLSKLPMVIKVENASTGPIDPMSRMNFGKVYTVEHNVKVRNIGRILPESIWRMDNYFAECLMIDST